MLLPQERLSGRVRKGQLHRGHNGVYSRSIRDWRPFLRLDSRGVLQRRLWADVAEAVCSGVVSCARVRRWRLRLQTKYSTLVSPQLLGRNEKCGLLGMPRRAVHELGWVRSTCLGANAKKPISFGM